MAKQPDVVIIGAGVVGAACARSLATRGAQVLLVDAGLREGVATLAAAGMLAALAEAAPDDTVLALNVRARDIYFSLVPELEAETGVDIGLWRGGILQAVFSDAEMAHTKNVVARLRQSGFPADWLTADDMCQVAPGLCDRVRGGVLAPDDGSLNPDRLREALLASAARLGAEFRDRCPATGVVTRGDSVVGVVTQNEVISTGAVVVAAGCWSGRLTGLPRPLSVEPVKGQIAALQLTEERPRSIVYGAHGYVLTRGYEAIVGATAEHAGFETNFTDEGLEYVRAAGAHLFPELERAPLMRGWAGLRPGTPDGLPFIGPDPDVPNLWYATGHGRNGILLAGLTADIIARGFSDEAVEREVNLDPVDPSRFWKTHHQPIPS
jgi:glycine oxidase